MFCVMIRGNVMMRVLEIKQQKLVVTQREVPSPLAYQVVIKVYAAGVNRPDVLQRQGLYPPPEGASDIPGLEVAGIIIAVGQAVTHWQCGATVCALVTGGAYADYCLASAVLCLPMPTGFTFVQAAALPETFFTVWSNLIDRARLTANETLLVHGGSSGIGTTAIQLATARGAKVLVTAGSEQKCQACLALGATAAINYRTHDFVTEVNRLTAGQGVDVILDMVGGDYLPRNLKCMAFDARLVLIALQSGTKAELNLLPVMLRRYTLTGSTLRGRSDDFKAQIAQHLYQQVWPLLSSGRLRPIIYTTLPLTAAQQAHELMESGVHIGKIILEIDHD